MSDVDDKPSDPVAETNGDTGEGRAKRARKTVEFFKPAEPVAAPSEFVIKQGAGDKLGDIPNVKFLLSKFKNDDDVILNLHFLLFKSKGQAHLRKRHIFEFSGFVSGGDKEAETKRRQERAGKYSVEVLNRLLDCFELPRGSGAEGHKGEKVARLLKFLDAPKAQSDKDLAAEAEKKKEKAKKQREKAAAKKEKPTPSKKRKTPAKAKAEAESESEGEDESEGEHEPEEEAEEQPAKKKAKKEAAPKKAAAGKKATPKKAAAATPKAKGEKKAAKAKAEAKSPAKPEAEGEEAEEGEEAIQESTLREAVKEILDGTEDPGALSKKQLMAALKRKLGVNLKPYKDTITAIAVDMVRGDDPAPEAPAPAPEEAKGDLAEGQAETDGAQNGDKKSKEEAEEGGQGAEEAADQEMAEAAEEEEKDAADE